VVARPIYSKSIRALYFAYVVKFILEVSFIQRTICDIKAFQRNIALTQMEVLQLYGFPERVFKTNEGQKPLCFAIFRMSPNFVA